MGCQPAIFTFNLIKYDFEDKYFYAYDRKANMIIFLTIEITLLQNVFCLKIKGFHTKTTHRWIKKVILENTHQVKNLSAKSIFKYCIVGQVIDMETAS